MHRSETYGLVRCAACGVEVAEGRDRTFPFGEEDTLCFACALARGGKYDEQLDRWATQPDLSGLAEAR